MTTHLNDPDPVALDPHRGAAVACGGSGRSSESVTAAAAAASVLSDTGSLQPYSEASGKSGSEPLAPSPRRMTPTFIAPPRDRASSGSGSGRHCTRADPPANGIGSQTRWPASTASAGEDTKRSESRRSNLSSTGVKVAF